MTQPAATPNTIPRAAPHAADAATVDLGTGDVAELLDIHPSTVKRWFDETAAMAKTSGGHRRIPLDLALRVARVRGRSVYLHGFGTEAGRVWGATRALERGDPEPACAALVYWLRTRRPQLIGRFLWHVAGRGHTPDPRILDSVFGGFMQRVGNEWERGDLRIGDERAASREVAETIWRLLATAPRDADGAESGDVVAPSRPVAVVGTVEAEQHVLGSQLVRLLLAHRGWKVEHLGSGVPIPEIMATQQTLRAPLVCVSFTPPASAGDVRRFVRVAEDLADRRRPFSLVLGGGAASGVSVTSRLRALERLAVLDDLAGLADWLDAHFPSVARGGERDSASARA